LGQLLAKQFPIACLPRLSGAASAAPPSGNRPSIPGLARRRRGSASSPARSPRTARGNCRGTAGPEWRSSARWS